MCKCMCLCVYMCFLWFVFDSFLSCLFVLAYSNLLYLILFLYFRCLFSNESKKERVWVWVGSWVGRIWEKETVIRIYCMKNSIFNFKKRVATVVCICLCVSECHMCASTYRDPKKVSDPQEMELQTVVGCLT